MANRLHTVIKRTKADIQQCKDCNGNGSLANPARPPRRMDCPTCLGQGFFIHRAPYRLADGSWSDQVVRDKAIWDGPRATKDGRRTLCVYKIRGRREWYIDGLVGQEFPTFDAAVAHADSFARAKKGASS